MSRATITLSNANWEFIVDSLGDRLENLMEGQMNPDVDWDFSQDIRHAESLIAVIEKYNA
jgi:hypothetical protein